MADQGQGNLEAHGGAAVPLRPCMLLFVGSDVIHGELTCPFGVIGVCTLFMLEPKPRKF